MMLRNTGSQNIVNYSPVKQNRQNTFNNNQNLNSQDERFFSQTSTTSRNLFNNNDNDIDINGNSNSNRILKYIDQQEQEENQNFNSDQEQSSGSIIVNQEGEGPLEEEVLEEVYICNCCGISKELNPGIQFMSAYKCVFFLFNFLVFSFGLANFGMGLWFRIDPKVYEIHKYIETQNFTNAGWLLLFCGFLACLMSFIGFLATTKQAIGLLIFYLTIIILLTIAFIGTLTLLLVYGLGNSLEEFMVKEIYEQIRRKSMTTDLNISFQSTDAAQFMDFIQVKLRCCGATDFRDYHRLGMAVPLTCHTIATNFINAPGCGHAIRRLLDLRAGLATGFTLGSIISQLLTIITSALIFCSIYHYRATPRPTQIPMTPQPRLSTRSPTIIDNQSQIVYPRQQQYNHQQQQQQQPPRGYRTPSREPSPGNFEQRSRSQLHLQRPRSRTPIII